MYPLLSLLFSLKDLIYSLITYNLTGFVGEADRNSDNKYFLFTHKNIVIRYNGNQVWVS